VTDFDIELHRLGGRDSDGSPAFLGRWTFDTDQVRTVVEDALEGRVLNATAGKTRLRHGNGEIIRNDLNPDIPADHHVDVTCVDEHLEPESFDTVVFDPPFDAGQADKRYEGFHAKDVNAGRRALATLLRPDGVFVEFGWSSVGPAESCSGFAREKLHIFQRGPVLADVFGVVDRLVQRPLPTVDGGGSA
jgi:hypothetical protein